MGSLLMFMLFFFVLIIAIPIINIIRLFASVRKGGINTQYQREQHTYQQPEKTSPVNKRFDKSKAEDVEFEEV